MIAGMEAQVTTQGRVTIPIELRRRSGIQPGTRLIVREEESRIVVMTFAQYAHSLRGVLKGGKGRQALWKDRRNEMRRGDERFRRKAGML